MFTVKLVQPNIIEICQITFYFSRTLKQYYYKDIENWNDLTNPNATEQTGEFKVARKMHHSDIDWCKRYYIPKLEGSL